MSFKIPIYAGNKKKGTTTYLDFDVTNTTPSAGALTNVTGGDWSVVRNSIATYINDSDVLVEVAVNVPRIENTKVLIEPQAINKSTYSEDFSNGVWLKANISINLASSIVAPDGNTGSVYEQIENSADATHLLYRTLTKAEGTKEYMSFFVKRKNVDWAGVIQNRSPVPSSLFDLSDGSVSTNNNGSIGSVIAIGNGWYRLIIEYTITGTSTIQRLYNLINGTTNPGNAYLGDGVSGFYIWGGSLVEETALSSYIPTVASSVTREADVITVVPHANVTRIIETVNGSDNTITTIPATFTMKNGTSRVIMDDAA